MGLLLLVTIGKQAGYKLRKKRATAVSALFLWCNAALADGVDTERCSL